MNEQLQSKLVEILTSVQAATKAAGDFALEQLPDIAMQYVMYGRAVHSVGLAAGVLLTVAVLVFYWKRRAEIFGGYEVWPIPVLMFGGAGAVALLAKNLAPAMMVWFAPKVWLLKELAGMVR